MKTSPDAAPLLLLDFDGTVCVGDGPVWAYAEAVISGILDDPALEGAGIAERVRERLGAFLDGDPAAPGYLDGYAAVAAIAGDHVGEERLRDAYRASRTALTSGAIDVGAPEGLVGLLAELGPRVKRVLVTNAPADGVLETLERLGLDTVIDDVVTEAGKPAGWTELLPRLRGEREPSAVMAVGDIWSNDLEGPLSAGCATALIDRFGHRAGPSHLVGARFEELYDGIRDWANDPKSFVARHAPAAASVTAD